MKVLWKEEQKMQTDNSKIMYQCMYGLPEIQLLFGSYGFKVVKIQFIFWNIPLPMFSNIL